MPLEKRNQEKAKEKFKLLQPKNDFVFQSLFSERNKKITKEFVSALLNENIENMTINNTKELFREYPNDKLGILDLEADVNGREKVDIEVQMVKKEDFVDRLLFYFSKLYAMQIGRGDEYNVSKRVVLIAIIDYEMDITKGIEEMETKWQLRNGKNLRISID